MVQRNMKQGADRPAAPARQLTRRDLADQVAALRAQTVALGVRLSQAEAREADARTRAVEMEGGRNLAVQDRARAIEQAVTAEAEAKALRGVLEAAQAAGAEARRPAWRRWLNVPGRAWM